MNIAALIMHEVGDTTVVGAIFQVQRVGARCPASGVQAKRSTKFNVYFGNAGNGYG